MTHRIFNAGNVLGGTAFLAMIGVVGAASWAIENDGSYWSTIAFMVLLIACAYLSIREEGKRK